MTADKVTKEQRALMWAFDRLSIDDGMTEKEQTETARQLRLVLQGEPCAAGEYEPDQWQDSYDLYAGVMEQYETAEMSEQAGRG